MARRLVSLIIGSSLVAGCALNSAQTAGLPKPSFQGPVVAKPTYVPPPVAAKSTPVIPPTVAARPANVPAAWIPLPTAEKRQWTWIVIHHSATPTGGMLAFDKMHKAKGWDGVGYHFVIGNGTDTADGQIEVTPRWPIQKHGAHAKTPDNQFNEHGIGICLVGNMMNGAPTPKQMASLEKLVAYLADTYHIKQSNILGHKMTGKQTDCPGTYTNIAKIRADVSKMRKLVLAEDNDAPDPNAELMQTAAIDSPSTNAH
ncbi:MAG: peptidoglycan recognition family protein [Tepidisphaeraceae bacterium]